MNAIAPIARCEEALPRYADLTNAEVFAYTRLRRLQDIAARRNQTFGKYGPTQYGKRAVGDFVAHKVRNRRIRSTLTPALVKRLWQAQDGRCYICAKLMSRALSTPLLRPSLDHVIPISRGGENHGNILLAHQRCNEIKADRMPTSDELAYLVETNAMAGLR